MELTRLERISIVIEDTIEKLMSNMDKGEDNIYIYRYNYWMERFQEEVHKNLNVDVHKLNVSNFMRYTISLYIYNEEKYIKNFW